MPGFEFVLQVHMNACLSSVVEENLLKKGTFGKDLNDKHMDN